MRVTAALVACLCASAPARCENLLLALSSQQITIASNYAGSDITLFGAIRPGAAAIGAPGDWDLVVVAKGPSRTLVVREKERAGPIWVNRTTRRFPRLPSYLAVLSSRPLASIASAEQRARDQLGLLAYASAATPATSGLPPPEDAEFASALVRLQTGRRLWREDGEGVSFLDASLFRAAIHLPPDVPFGPFEVEARLYSKGTLVARDSITFRVVKAGFEAQVAALADTRRLAYGVFTALLALAFGWTASVMFRRD